MPYDIKHIDTLIMNGTLLSGAVLISGTVGVAGSSIVSGTITSAQITPGTITTLQMAANTIVDANVASGALKIQEMSFFQGTTVGTSGPQNIAHGLGVVPKLVIAYPIIFGGISGIITVYGSHTTTNVVVGTGSGQSYGVLAIA